ncbi:methylglyoxal reductase (NADPH-dependent) gre2 [Tulasnella sp. 403]|nr:methylglyoxal reductase (NADPH-dependent) gre2 [Tulasnella sp. 403]
MAPVSAPAKVLVTGASGFIATWVVKTLLEQGYKVVGTVRSTSKGEYLKKLFKEHDDKFTYVIVDDISKEGAFDEAVVGVDAVEHTASPFHFKADDPQELVTPAVNGTVGVLRSIQKHALNVKRVVITSSVASIVYDKGPGAHFDESDWNEESPIEVEVKGRNASAIHKYRASKVLAERAAWDFVHANKDSLNFDLVTICPPVVLGPIIHEVPSAEALNTSVAMFHKATTITDGQEPSRERLTNPAGNWVDVRDVATVHVAALSHQAAGVDALHASGERSDIPKGYPGAGKDVVNILYVADKAERTFGLKFRSKEDSAAVTLAALRERGF